MTRVSFVGLASVALLLLCLCLHQAEAFVPRGSARVAVVRRRDAFLARGKNDNQDETPLTSQLQQFAADRSSSLLASAGPALLLLSNADVACAAEAAGSAIPVARTVIDVFVNTLSLLFLCRTVLSWYPKTNLNEFPYSIAAWPTEPLLLPVRSLIPPAFGVDVSSIVWVMLLSFLREILTGQQGILTLLEKS